MQGVEFEQDGKLFEAVRFYRKAEKLVPNIEYQAYKFNSGSAKACTKPTQSSKNVDDNGNVEHIISNDSIDIANLVSKFARLKVIGECGISKEYDTSMRHIGELPSEVLNLIIKWVVSNELDLLSLESCSLVCRAFYIAARDEEIWKLICCKIWGLTVFTKNNSSSCCWREMFLSRPRTYFNGCYVSKMRYIREGERSFQDQETYKAWHIVEYCRYLRFFPGGQVIMALSSDDEAIIAKQLNSKTGGLSIPGAILGRFKIVEDTVVCILHKPKAVDKKKPKRRGKKEIDYSFEVPDQDFHMELRICGEKWRFLDWNQFNIVSKYSNGNERVDNFNIKDKNKYPRYNVFVSMKSVTKSYSNISEPGSDLLPVISMKHIHS